MPKPQNWPLVIGGWLSVAASVLHVAVIFGGPDWYRTFGAGEQMARLAEAGDPYPTIVTSFIAVVLMAWAAYAFAGAGLVRRLPLMKTALVAITGVYLLRGLGVIPLMLMDIILVDAFAIWSSLICTVYGLAYLFGTRRAWADLG